jgi:hypothetical protein
MENNSVVKEIQKPPNAPRMCSQCGKEMPVTPRKNTDPIEVIGATVVLALIGGIVWLFGVWGKFTLLLLGFFVYLYVWLLDGKDGTSDCCDVCANSGKSNEH